MGSSTPQHVARSMSMSTIISESTIVYTLVSFDSGMRPLLYWGHIAP